MYAAVRTYTGPGAKEFFDLLEKRKSEVEAVMRSVPGLESRYRKSLPSGNFEGRLA